jgi:alcohol dehydrogenase class IV
VRAGGPDGSRALAGRSFEIGVRDRSVFGVGALAGLARHVREAGGRRVFVVTDPGVVASGVANQVREVLAAEGVDHVVWSGVSPNPGTSTVEAARDALQAFGSADVVVLAVGGGSSMDTAKAVSLAAGNPGVGVMALGYHEAGVRDGRPVIAVPTTAGTGAETNTYGVITDEAVGRKGYIGHPSVLPVVAILDPALTLGLPPAATAATGVDAMTHALESLLSRNPNPFAEAVALGVIRTVARWLPPAVADGSDLEARSELLLASHLAGIAQASGTGVGLVHAIGHAVGTRARLAHGTALATVMPEVFRFYGPIRERELALVGVAFGVASPAESDASAAAAAVGAVERLLDLVGQRRRLADLGLAGPSLDTIAEDALADPAIANSPRLPDRSAVRAILEAVAT